MHYSRKSRRWKLKAEAPLVLEEIRGREKIAAEPFAAYMNISISTYSRILAGTRLINRVDVTTLIEAMGLRLSDEDKQRLIGAMVRDWQRRTLEIQIAGQHEY